MRRPASVRGRTDRVVVVGAGLSGLAAAMHLRAAGREVTVLEREAIPGGRAGLLAGDGYRFDTGPTVLTMPDLLARPFEALGERLTDHLVLDRLDPGYRGHFPDGSTLDVRADPDATAAGIEALCGPAEAEGFRRFAAWAKRLYELERVDFIDRNLDAPWDLLTPDLARLAGAGGFRRLSTMVGRFLKDPRTTRMFSFQSLYVGLAPQDALALYGVIAYMDSVAGVYFPRGGMHAVPEAMAAVAAAHGVTFHYGVEVTGVEHDGRRAHGVRTTPGERIRADTVVLTPDLPVAARDLLGARVRPLRYSPSAVVLLLGAKARYERIAHHNLHFGRSWTGVFDDLVRRGRVPADPSLLVTNPTRTDSTLAPPGRESYYVLAPVPHLDAPVDWGAHGAAYADELLSVLERRGYVGLGDAVEVRHVTTPADWAARGMARGTPFAAAHTFGQTGPFRPRNRWGDNVVFAGSGTVPGVGVPMVLVSGRLAAARVTGTG